VFGFMFTLVTAVVLTILGITLSVFNTQSDVSKPKKRSDFMSFRVFQKSKEMHDKEQLAALHYDPWYEASSLIQPPNVSYDERVDRYRPLARSLDKRVSECTEGDILTAQNAIKISKSEVYSSGLWGSSLRSRNKPFVLPRIPQLMDAEIHGPGSQLVGYFNRTTRSYDSCDVSCVLNTPVSLSKDGKERENIALPDVQIQLESTTAMHNQLTGKKLAKELMRLRPRMPRKYKERCGLLPKMALWLHSIQVDVQGPLMDAYDLILSPRLESDIPIISANWRDYDLLGMAPKSFSTLLGSANTDDSLAASLPSVNTKAENKALAVAFVSDCHVSTQRLHVMDELERHGLSLHSYGKCRQNVQIPTEYQQLSWQLQKRIIISQYKFALILESIIEVDHVSEQMYDAIHSGSVPVVFGAPNIRDFAPADGTFINAVDFHSTKDLVDFLKKLSANTYEYEGYLNRWKVKGVSRNFEKLVGTTSNVHVACRVCRALNELQKKDVQTMMW